MKEKLKALWTWAKANPKPALVIALLFALITWTAIAGANHGSYEGKPFVAPDGSSRDYLSVFMIRIDYDGDGRADVMRICLPATDTSLRTSCQDLPGTTSDFWDGECRLTRPQEGFVVCPALQTHSKND